MAKFGELPEDCAQYRVIGCNSSCDLRRFFRRDGGPKAFGPQTAEYGAFRRSEAGGHPVWPSVVRRPRRQSRHAFRQYGCAPQLGLVVIFRAFVRLPADTSKARAEGHALAVLTSSASKHSGRRARTAPKRARHTNASGGGQVQKPFCAGSGAIESSPGCAGNAASRLRDGFIRPALPSSRAAGTLCWRKWPPLRVDSAGGPRPFRWSPRARSPPVRRT